jgi:hypothetical protein
MSLMFRLLSAPLLVLTMSGCSTETTLTDDFSTELTVVAAGNIGDDFEIRKRFTFSRSPAEARRFEVVNGLVTVLEPYGQDLTFLHRISVYVEVEETGERILVAEGGDFERDETWSIVEPVYMGDIGEFVGADSRLTLVFSVEPNGWLAESFPAGGVTVLARATVEILL